MHSKMTLTYIFHSGFVLETEKSILIFDYWLDPYDVVSSFLKKNKHKAAMEDVGQSH